MSASSDSRAAANPATDRAARAQAYTPGASDGLGDRLLVFDPVARASMELLRFRREFAEWPGFETALRARVDEVRRLRHTAFASIQTVEWLDGGEGLALVTSHAAGHRLSELVASARGVPFALELVRQLAPALAALQDLGPGVAHGVLTTDRVIVTREGRLFIVEHALGSAIESLWLPAPRLRAEIGIAVQPGTHPIRLDARGDVVQLGLLALTLLLGKRLEPEDYPAKIGAHLDEFSNADPGASFGLRPWLERALQLGARPFSTAREAHLAFQELPDEIEFRSLVPPAGGDGASRRPMAVVGRAALTESRTDADDRSPAPDRDAQATTVPPLSSADAAPLAAPSAGPETPVPEPRVARTRPRTTGRMLTGGAIGIAIVAIATAVLISRARRASVADERSAPGSPVASRAPALAIDRITPPAPESSAPSATTGALPSAAPTPTPVASSAVAGAAAAGEATPTGSSRPSSREDSRSTAPPAALTYGGQPGAGATFRLPAAAGRAAVRAAAPAPEPIAPERPIGTTPLPSLAGVTAIDMGTTAIAAVALARAPESAAGFPSTTIYGTSDEGVTPPAPVSRAVPAWRPSGAEAHQVFEGQLVLVVDPSGHVASVSLVTHVHPRYDDALVAAAKAWTFRPATKDGAPVAYRLAVAVRLSGPGR